MQYKHIFYQITLEMRNDFSNYVAIVLLCKIKTEHIRKIQEI